MPQPRLFKTEGIEIEQEACSVSLGDEDFERF
jgi:hypothetical protein